MDKTALNAALEAAQNNYDTAVEGFSIGQYIAGAKGLLNTVIAAAVRDNAAATADQVAQAVTDLNGAHAAFQAKLITAGTGDFNINDFPGIDIGDLGIIVYHYGITSQDADWNLYGQCDINGDDAIGLYEMQFIIYRLIHALLSNNVAFTIERVNKDELTPEAKAV